MNEKLFLFNPFNIIYENINKIGTIVTINIAIIPITKNI